MAKILLCNAQSGDVLTSFSSTDLENFIASKNKDFKFEVQIQENNFEPIAIGNYVILHEKKDPGPTPTPGLIYDSDTDIDWSHDQKITDVYGTFKPNGKYFRMKASGSPRMYIDSANKQLILEHDGDFGRAYFGVCNYQSRLECEFKLDSCSHNFSMKTRNRHQYRDVNPDATDEQRQGGMGNAYHCDSVENDLEIVHGTGGEGGSSKSLSPKLEANKWYKIKFSQYDSADKTHIHIKDELDRGDGQGFKVVADAAVPAPSQFFNKDEFMQWSEFWLRLNAVGGGRVYIKNIKMYAL